MFNNQLRQSISQQSQNKYLAVLYSACVFYTKQLVNMQSCVFWYALYYKTPLVGCYTARNTLLQWLFEKV